MEYHVTETHACTVVCTLKGFLRKRGILSSCIYEYFYICMGIFLEWVATSFSRGPSWLRDWTCLLHWQANSLPLSPLGCPRYSILVTKSRITIRIIWSCAVSVLNIHQKDWCWSWSSNTLATWWEELTHCKRPWCWERLKAGEGDDRGWDGWMASPTRWTWVLARSGNCYWRGKPGTLESMGLERVGHDWVTELSDWLKLETIGNENRFSKRCLQLHV